ncbi:hypothetical protein CNMCM5623_003655 [Aspergillus felis]|uniref:TauD/TfdA-like domain-containing protein n=1 Tax=Aspergillus felis TaxID=1287682 RepID=A0A8H6QMS9_9EURO|nr:hypothetical protein CNMCM5623_003655 [Aspergillus felis]KAF7174682.1 hypothetical protein CNMCM7691_003368 [Aspergillus felis]
MKYPTPGRLQQVHVGITPKGFVPVTSYQGGKDLYEEEHETLQTSLLRLCPAHLWYQGSHATSCPRPILVTPEHQGQLLALHTALAAAITDIVERWWTDSEARFPERMPLQKAEEELLRWLETKDLPYHDRLGSWRPDFLVEEGAKTERFRITEINARFSFNGFMHQAYGQTALDALGVGRHGVTHATDSTEMLQGLLRLFRPDLPLHLLKGAEPGIDIHMFIEFVHRHLGTRPRLISPADLRLLPDPAHENGYRLCCLTTDTVTAEQPVSPLLITSEGEVVEEIHQVGLELHQHELFALQPEMLRQVSMRCFNDMRTVLLAHDKRMLGIVQQEVPSLVARGVLSPSAGQALKNGIADTILPGSPELNELIEQCADDDERRKEYLLKPIRGGKGAGIIFGDEITASEWRAVLERLRDPAIRAGITSYVVQRRVIPVLYEVILNSSGDPGRYPLIGTYHAAQARDPVSARYEYRGLATAPAAAVAVEEPHDSIPGVAHIVAEDMSDAERARHVREVRDRLEHDGILKISLRFADDTSQYLKTLVLGLHKHHGHGLPITHSASQGWFWDVKPSHSSFQTQNHQARSETMADFPWHTDCSYETCPPRFFALHVLHPDRYGGGTLSVMNVQRLGQLLSASARDALSRPDYRISIPLEFIKQPEQRHIVGSILAGRQKTPTIRFRGELVTPLNEGAATALDELKGLLREVEMQPASTLHLAASDLPRNSIILLDNRRWLHARNAVKDPARHLRRVRWDAVPFIES